MSLILIVDDDPLLRATLSIYLRHGHFRTMEAATAESAMQLVSQRTFDLAIVDQRLPDQAGDQLASSMRQLGIPCIMFTGIDEEEALPAATRAGAVACLIKPVDMPTLLAAVRSAIASQTSR